MHDSSACFTKTGTSLEIGIFLVPGFKLQAGGFVGGPDGNFDAVGGASPAQLTANSHQLALGHDGGCEERRALPPSLASSSSCHSLLLCGAPAGCLSWLSPA